MGQPEVAYSEVAGRSIAYRLRPGASPTLVFLPGYASDMEGTKAVALDGSRAARAGMLRLDYSGTGSSGGRVRGWHPRLWLEEALAAIDRLTDGPLVLVGSSMGGWIALHLALLRPERVQASSASPRRPTSPTGALPMATQPSGQGLSRAFWESGSSSCCSTTRSRSIARFASSTATGMRTCPSMSRFGRWRGSVQPMSS